MYNHKNFYLTQEYKSCKLKMECLFQDKGTIYQLHLKTNPPKEKNFQIQNWILK